MDLAWSLASRFTAMVMVVISSTKGAPSVLTVAALAQKGSMTIRAISREKSLFIWVSSFNIYSLRFPAIEFHDLRFRIDKCQRSQAR